MDKVESNVAAKITIRSQISECAIKTCPGVMASSLSDACVKRVCFLAEGELNCAKFFTGATVRRDDFPVGVVERGSEIVDRISAQEGSLVYDAFVLFTPKGALASSRVCFKDKGERLRFVQKLVEIRDVCCSPLKLEKCAVCHRPKQSSL